MARRNYSKEDRERAHKLRDLGCIVCINEHSLYTPPAIHHIDGQTKPNCHQLTIPLCAKHHQIKCNHKLAGAPMWISRHGDGRKAFEKRYGTEQELLEQVNGLI